MPFDFHNRDRIENLITELKEQRYKKLTEIKSFHWYRDDGSNGNRIPMGEAEEVGIGFRWKGWDQYNWLCTQIVVPEVLKEEEVVGLFDFGVPEGTGNNSHFESLLYLNGIPYQGVDGNHKEVFFDVAKNGLVLDLKFRVWSGLNGGGVPKEMPMEIERAQFGVLDKKADEFYYLAKNALETYDLLDKNNEYKEWLLNILVKAFQIVDYAKKGQDEFYESIEKALLYLDEKLDGRGKPDINVSLLGHTHIDVAWLWQLKHTREKAARSFSTVNRMMERYPYYQFLQTQAQLYDFIRENYPDIYENIKTRVKEGKWEPSGSMWVECDCNLVSGESLVRQILLGKRFFEKEFGYQNDFLWLPDVFGYSWALPQILKKSGIHTFMTTKISWNDSNKLPYDTFLWKGMDGTEILSHFITTPDTDSTSYTYNGDTRPYAVKGIWDNYSNKDINKDLLIAYGYGDGGGGPNRDMLETIKHLNKLPGIPHIKTESATDYFHRLQENLRNNEMEGYLPVWDGELYLEFHRGTYTSQAYNKRMNRKMEYSLRSTEMLSVLAAELTQLSYPYKELEEAWKIVLCHQFHDILPGSSIREVYEDSKVNYEKAEKLLEDVREKVNKSLFIPEEGTYTVYNNSNWRRDSYVLVTEGEREAVFVNEKGEELESMPVAEGVLVFVKNMEPFSFTILKQKPEKTSALRNVRTEGDINEVSNAFYRVSWNSKGWLTSIYDKRAGREILKAGEWGNVLQVFEDKPRCFDAWELEATHHDKQENVEDLRKVTVEETSLGIFVTFHWTYNKSAITQRMCLYHEKARLDFQTEVDWHEQQKLLKADFPVNIRAVDARFDIQFGNIRRPITRNTSWEAAKFEVVAHKWADISETGYGVALLNDCKYGHDFTEDMLRLTLIKSAIDPDYSADQGFHEFTYAIYPHRNEWYESDLEKEAFDLNNPITAIPGRAVFSIDSFLRFSEENISVDCMKQAEDSKEMVIRFHEFTGARKTITVDCSVPVKAWCESNLMEEAEGEYQTGPVCIAVKPYEIKTLLFRF